LDSRAPIFNPFPVLKSIANVADMTDADARLLGELRKLPTPLRILKKNTQNLRGTWSEEGTKLTLFSV
jgi:hypothetical protein